MFKNPANEKKSNFHPEPILCDTHEHILSISNSQNHYENLAYVKREQATIIFCIINPRLKGLFLRIY